MDDWLVAWDFEDDADGNVAHIIAIVFVCRVTGGDLKISHESTDAGWFDFHNLPDPMTPSHRVRLKDYSIAHTDSSLIPIIK